MNTNDKQQLRILLTAYFDEVNTEIERAEETEEDTALLDDLLTSIDDVRNSVSTTIQGGE